MTTIRLTSLAALLITVPVYSAGDIDDALNALAETVQSRSNSGWFSGVAIAAVDGVVVFEEAHGVADRARDIPMKVDTPINLGSASKMFVAVAIAQLKMAGDLEYEHAAVRYLPELDSKISDRMTLADLLAHTSGLTDIVAPELWEMLQTAANNHDVFEIAASLAVQEQPGGQMRYTNANFVFLGEIIERLTKTPFEEHITRSILDPAGMQSTHFIKAGDRSSGDIAINYMDVDAEQAMAMMSDRSAQQDFAKRSQENQTTDGFVHEAPLFGGGMVANGSGGVYSTAGDLLRFTTALRNSKLLPWDEVLELCEPRSPPRRSGRAYGLGCESRFTGLAAENIGHGGLGFGMQVWMQMYPNLGLDLIILSNHERQADPLLDSVNNVLRSE